MSSKPFGYELIVDLRECDVDVFTALAIEGFCKDLCKEIDMIPEDFHIWASDPADYETDPPHLHGVSAVQFITTSTIVIHTLSKLRAAHINIFSCKVFDQLAALTFATKFFNGVLVQSRFLERL